LFALQTLRSGRPRLPTLASRAGNATFALNTGQPLRALFAALTV
jgi:hypothetical protein